QRPVLGEMLDGFAEEGEEVRDLLVSPVQLADLDGCVAGLPEDGEDRSRDQAENGHGHGDLEEGESRGRWRGLLRGGLHGSAMWRMSTARSTCSPPSSRKVASAVSLWRSPRSAPSPLSIW